MAAGLGLRPRQLSVRAPSVSAHPRASPSSPLRSSALPNSRGLHPFQQPLLARASHDSVSVAAAAAALVPLLEGDVECSSGSKRESTEPAAQHGAAQAEGAATGGGLFRALPPRLRGILLLNLLTLLFGTNVAIVKEAQEGLGPWAFSAGRFALAALAFSPCLPTALSSSRTLRAGAELGAIAAAGYACQAWGLQSTSASHTSFLGSFTVLLVPFLAGLTGRTIPLRTWAATGVALLGICALELGGVDAGGSHQAMLQLGGFSLPASACGDAASLVSAALFALQLLRTEHHCSKLGEGGAPLLISAQLTTLALIFGALTVAVPTPAMDALLRNADGPQALLTALPLKEWLLTGVVSTAGALWAELEALREVSAPDAALVYATEPVWGAVTAFFLLGERWTGSTWLGAALILSGSLYGQKTEEGEGEKEAS